MFQAEIPPIRPGDEITASWLNRVRDAAIVLLKLRVEPPLEIVRSAAGLVIRLVHNPRFWLKVASGKQPYAWADQVPAAGGGWSTGQRSGTIAVDPAYEQNGNTAVPAGIIVLARRASGTRGRHVPARRVLHGSARPGHHARPGRRRGRGFAPAAPAAAPRPAADLQRLPRRRARQRDDRRRPLTSPLRIGIRGPTMAGLHASSPSPESRSPPAC